MPVSKAVSRRDPLRMTMLVISALSMLGWAAPIRRRAMPGRSARTMRAKFSTSTCGSAASPFLDASIAADEIVYPPPDQQRRLFVQTEDSPDQSRLITRLWQKFKTGQ
jgi:hypothetical protein